MDKEKRLAGILRELESAVIAFSGGVDSAYLLYWGLKVLGDNVLAVTAVSPLCAGREKDRAVRLAKEMGARHIILPTPEIIALPAFLHNTPDRCYHCKKALLEKFRRLAVKHGCRWVCEGSNGDDMNDYRPGLRAVREMGVRSPLLEAGLTKEEIRHFSRRAGLDTWNLPSAACLASRLPYGEPVTAEKLKVIDRAEEHLRSLGFEPVRVRHYNDTARLEVSREDFPCLPEKRADIVSYLKGLGFTYITLDLEGFRSGSMNEVLVENFNQGK